jgi:hypothetical protein
MPMRPNPNIRALERIKRFRVSPVEELHSCVTIGHLWMPENAPPLAQWVILIWW